MAIRYRRATVDGLSVFYREAGDPDRPTLLLLHGFPTSSVMFRDLIPLLADDFHLIAPDLPGFGQTDMPAVDEFDYTFDHLADVIDKFVDQLGLGAFGIYVQDYGSPVGFRLALKRPDQVRAIITQNGNAYEEGLVPEFWAPLREFWADWNPATEAPVAGALVPEMTVWQYLHGEPDAELVSPDAIALDNALLARPGARDVQLQLFHNYGTNPPLYPTWQAFLRERHPGVLAVWGGNDQIFGPDGARAFAKDVPDAEIHLLDAGHFALETQAPTIAALIRDFAPKHLS
jgi:pimeloyl-ACP methyl ester carboxylesterase